MLFMMGKNLLLNFLTNRDIRIYYQEYKVLLYSAEI
nr:MAG TPA: hypothetical protein [Bacteriophage sp.]